MPTFEPQDAVINNVKRTTTSGEALAIVNDDGSSITGGASTAPLALYDLLGVSGTVTASGYYVDNTGTQVGNSFSALSIPIGNGSNNAAVFPSIPASAVGVLVRLSGNIYWATPPDAGTTADFKANYANYPKAIADPEYNIFGRA